MADLSEWLELCGAPPQGAKVSNYIYCEKDNVPMCCRGCMRATLIPCINICHREIAEPAIYQIATPYFIARVLKFRNNLYAASQDTPGDKQAEFIMLADDCIRSGLPLWTKEWSAVCDAALKRICEKLCTSICQRKCVTSCKLPCAKLPVNQRHNNRNALRRVVKCMRKCVIVCTAVCKRACFSLAKKWFWIKAKRIYRSMLIDAARQFTDEWIQQDLIEERKQLTNKCNVLNGCQF